MDNSDYVTGSPDPFLFFFAVSDDFLKVKRRSPYSPSHRSAYWRTATDLPFAICPDPSPSILRVRCHPLAEH